jgi:hypothetical protein
VRRPITTVAAVAAVGGFDRGFDRDEGLSVRRGGPLRRAAQCRAALAAGNGAVVAQARRYPAAAVLTVRCPIIGTVTCQDIKTRHTQAIVNVAAAA